MDKSRRDDGFQIVFLAKNKKGYKNLSIMSSIAYTEGFYYVPRIDKEIIKKVFPIVVPPPKNLTIM